MVDTLVLGTSANAWEFESLHAHHLKQMELTKSAPSGAFLVYSSPIGHA